MLVSNRKRYLTGPDWVIACLDRMLKNTTCCGNMSQIVLELDAPLDERETAAALNGFVAKFPVLRGHIARDIKLAPYWKTPGAPSPADVVTVHRAGDLMPGLENTANTMFRDETDHVAFHLFQDGTKSCLAMAFDHRIFDARGAEMFLDLFTREHGSGTMQGDIAFTSTAALSEWPRKFLAGRNVNRRIMTLSKTSVPKALPLPQAGTGAYHYRVLSFDEQETKAIYEQAYQKAGYLMESPYLLSAIVQSVHGLFAGKQCAGDSYLIPVTTDLRTSKEALQETFFNYVSYLFYQVPIGLADDKKGIIALLKQQMYDQVKSGFPRDLAEASLLTRIAPLPLLGKMLHLPLKGRMATFAFSHLGKSAYGQGTFFGRRIRNIFHMPRVPVPPGIGFFSNYFNNRLNLVISHLDGLLSDDDLRRLESGIRERFRSGATR